MNARSNRQARSHADADVDARIGNALIEVKFGVDAIRTLRTSLMQVAYAAGEDPAASGYIVLVDSPISEERLRHEWERAATVLRDDVLHRLTICLQTPARILGIPNDPDTKTQSVLSDVIESERGRMHTIRTDYSFIIQKLLLHRWLTNPEPVTSEWLGRTAGCSYPAVARALNSLGSLVERTSDRRVTLRWFPEDAFARIAATADRARSTTRFADQSGQPRSVVSHLRRLEKLSPPGLAIGGALGANHYDSGLDLVGTPRLDLSLHCPGKKLNLAFIKHLDPALKLVEDPLAPANVIVHAVRHADPLFTPREGGLDWADPVECLFDLHEARLDQQATQFLQTLQSQRPSA
jgi:hypothetical protein